MRTVDGVEPCLSGSAVYLLNLLLTGIRYWLGVNPFIKLKPMLLLNSLLEISLMIKVVVLLNFDCSEQLAGNVGLRIEVSFA
jgi:hypothetical protein